MSETASSRDECRIRLAGALAISRVPDNVRAVRYDTAHAHLPKGVRFCYAVNSPDMHGHSDAAHRAHEFFVHNGSGTVVLGDAKSVGRDMVGKPCP